MIYKKGAMFGLDARIALAIFGALSIISGAALYSAIENAKVTSIVVDMKEVAKAWEQFYLDTGSQLTKHGSYSYNAKDLVEDPGFSGWSGPYLPYSVPSGNYVLEYPQYNHIHISYLEEGSDWGSKNCSGTVKQCYVWVVFNSMPAAYADKIDEAIDGSDGLTVGNFQASHTNSIYHLKVASVDE